MWLGQRSFDLISTKHAHVDKKVAIFHAIIIDLFSTAPAGGSLIGSLTGGTHTGNGATIGPPPRTIAAPRPRTTGAPPPPTITAAPRPRTIATTGATTTTPEIALSLQVSHESFFTLIWFKLWWSPFLVHCVFIFVWFTVWSVKYIVEKIFKKACKVKYNWL